MNQTKHSFPSGSLCWTVGRWFSVGCSLPEGERQGDVHLDPEGVGMCSGHRGDLADRQEVRLSQWRHFVSGQEDLLALGAHRVGRCYLAEQVQYEQMNLFNIVFHHTVIVSYLELILRRFFKQHTVSFPL